MSSRNILSGITDFEMGFPSGNFPSGFEKVKWGREMLGNYVASIHGAEHRHATEDGYNINRLTGMHISVIKGDKVITYALLEPTKNPGKKVFIIKTEADAEMDDYPYLHLESMDGQESALAMALKKVDVAKLPEKAEIVVLEVNRHPKSHQPAIKPLQVENDPLVGGKSVRMFHVCGGGKVLSMGQRWKARITGNPIVTRKHKPGMIPVIHLNIHLLELAS